MVQHRAKRKSGPSLTEKLSVMEDLLATSQDELQLAEAEHQQLEWKELILLDVVRHQEALDIAMIRCQEIKATRDAASHVSARGGPIPEAMSAFQSIEQQGASSLLPVVEQPMPESHCTRPFADIPGKSYNLQLLQNATMQQIQRVLDMTVDSWIEYFQGLYMQLTALMNMAAHATKQDWATVAALTQNKVNCQTAENVDNRSAGDTTVPQQPTSVSVPTTCSSQQQRREHDDHRLGVAASAACVRETGDAISAAAAEAANMQGVPPPPHVPGVCIAADMLRLNQLVDDCFTLLLLAAMLTPDTIMGVMYTHLGTRQRYTIPPAMKQAIAARLRLTQGQAQQLAACFKHFRSIHASTTARCTELTDRASDVSMMVAAAAAEQAKTSLAAGVEYGDWDVPAVGWTLPAASRLKAKKTEESMNSMSKEILSDAGEGLSLQTAMPEDARDAAADDSDSIGQQLQGQLQRRLRLQLLEYSFISNTLTHLQKATLLISSYPKALVITSAAEAVKQALEPCAGSDRAAGSFANPAFGALDTNEYWRCMQENHEQRRLALLLEQRQQWWKELQDGFGNS